MNTTIEAPRSALGRGFKRVREVMQKQPPKQDNDAIVRLRQLVVARQELQEHWQGLLKHGQSIFTEHQEATRRFSQNPTVSTLDEAINTHARWLAAQVFAHDLAKQFQAGVVDSEFRRLHPDFRDVLLSVCKFHLMSAQNEHDKILKAETARLAGKNFDLSEVAASPECKRAAAKVERYQTLLNSIERATAESVWQTYSGQLLDDE